MTKVRIEVVNAIIDGKKHGEQLDVTQSEADQLVAIGYAKIVQVAEPAAEKPAEKKAAPKKAAVKK